MIKDFIFSLVFLLVIVNSSFSQCLSDRHSSTWYDGWISCQTKDSPNPLRGDSHFILYELDNIYYLYEMKIWNLNAPDLLNYDIQNVIVDVSDDGNTWTEFGQFTFSQATGKNDYEGIEEINFNGQKAKFVLFTPTSNYGGACYGLSEIKVRARDLCQSSIITWKGGTGDWNVPTNWCGDQVPTLTDSVWIPPYQTVNVPIAYSAEALWLDVDVNSILNINGILNIEGD